MTTDGFPTSGAIREEERRLRKLRLLVDLTAAVIRTRPLSRLEAQQAVGHLRRRALELFPDKGPVFDLIYGSRFRRLIEARFGAGDSPTPPAET
jgi:hypothetical protein